MPVLDHEGGTFAHFGLFYFYLATDNVGRFLSCGDDGTALGELLEEQTDVRWLDDFQKLVRSIVLKTTHRGGGVIEGDAFPGEEFYQIIFVESLFPGEQEVVLVVEVDEAEDAPHVVLQVRIEEIHAPALPLWWKTAQHQQSCVAGQERF